MRNAERYMRLRGDGLSVNRYRVDKENTLVHLYLDVLGEYTVADLLAALAEHAAGYKNVTFRGGCFVITVPATPEDVATWEQRDADHEEGGRKSRREWYERLRAEFEGPDTRVTSPGGDQ